MTDFIAVDGEALADDSYVLLCDSEGGSTANGQGLSTREIFSWLLGQERPRGAKLVAFGLNYDVNKWLRDVPKPLLKILWERQTVYWRNYRIRWVPRREFIVADTDGRKARISEVWGFFQCSLIDALADWGIALPGRLEAMKARRGSFTLRDLESGHLATYCAEECELLAQLMRALESACLRAGIYPERWLGAGSLAGWLLKEEEVAEHHRHDARIVEPRAGRPVRDGKPAVMCAYFGGRTEIFQAGPFEDVQSVDIRSAYPWAMTKLRSLAGTELRYTWDPSRFDADLPALWRVRWEGLEGAVMPFPVRQDRSIYYPAQGEGVYHAVEVGAALEAGFECELIEGWLLDPVRPIWPFTWIHALYAQRHVAAELSDPRAKVLKLALNALYGKLAQGYTQKPDSLPRWQSYFWAGEVTARVRARMLNLAMSATEPLSIATDGLIAREIDELGAPGLGELERHAYSSLFLAQAGIYQGERDDGEQVRTRGHFVAELDFDQIRAGFEEEGLEHVHRYTSRRFVGLGSALNSKRMAQWGAWPEETHCLSLRPARKSQRPGTLELEPPSGANLGPSEPYVPKQDLNETENPDDLQFHEQPLIVAP